jgi:uncharacterized Tic20 family protein
MEQQSSLLGKEELPAIPPTTDEKTMAILSHILTIFGSFLPPLIIYLIKNKESAFIAAHAKEALNFQITLVIVMTILVITIIGILLIWVVGVVALILVIIAAIRASEGKLYRYPFTLRLIK